MTPALAMHGFRVEVPAETVVYARDALVIDPEGLVIDELTIGVRYRRRYASAGLAWTGLAASSPRLGRVMPGNLVLDGHVVQSSGRVAVAFGARLSVWIPLGDVVPEMWGTVGEAMMPTYGFAFTTSGAAGPLIWSVRTGLKAQTWAGGSAFGYAAPLDLDTGLAWVQPIAGPVALVVEGEALLDPSPLNARLLVRITDKQLAIDVGAAAGFPDFLSYPTADLLFAARGAW